MDVDRLLNFEKRTGVKNGEIEDFNRKVDDVQAAIQGLLNGTVNPEDVKIDGIETEEEKKQKEIERQKRLQAQREKEEKLRIQRKLEERERWWSGAEVFKPSKDSHPQRDAVIVSEEAEAAEERHKLVLQRYTADYSKWNEWVPTDEATLLEKAEIEKSEEERKNQEFENNNAEFCNQFKDDMAKRKAAADKKQESANILRLKGNRFFQARQYDRALELYMDALKDLPFDFKTVGNIAQVYIKQKQYDDALEFLSRTLYLDSDNIKALSRKALVLGEIGQISEAIKALEHALRIEPTNKDLLAQQKELKAITAEKQQELAATAALEGVVDAASTEHAMDVATAVARTAPPVEQFKELQELLGSIRDAGFQDMSSLPGSDGLNSVAVGLLTKIRTDNTIKVLFRTTGTLSVVISAAKELCELLQSKLSGNQTASVSSNDHDFCSIFAQTNLCVLLLHLVSSAVNDQRSAKMQLLEGKLLSALKGLLKVISPSNHCELLVACLQLFTTCGIDDAAPKAQASILSDKTLLCSLGELLGNVSFNHITNCKTSAAETRPTDARDAGQNATLSAENAIALISMSAELLKTAAFSDLAQSVLKALEHDHAGAASIVCGVAAALHCTLHSFPAAVSTLTNSAVPHLLVPVARRVDVLEMLVDTAVGLSQVEALRAAFALEMPIEDAAALSHSERLGQRSKVEEICLVQALLQTAKSYDVFATNAISAIMNASLTSDGSVTVRQAVQKHGGLELALSGLTLSDSDRLKVTRPDGNPSLLVRKAGLLARLSAMAEVQQVLQEPDMYRLLSRRLAANVAVSTDTDSCLVEERNHYVRCMASLTKVNAVCIKIGVEEGVIDALLSLFPTPREECGEITARSVTLMPHDLPPALLLGNAARCLMVYADGAAQELYATVTHGHAASRKCVEKLICSMASCPDMRVRKNIAILLAKACRVPGVREKVTELRGMQMMIELQDQL